MPVRSSAVVEARRRAETQLAAVVRDLRLARCTAGLSQATIARALHVSRQLVAAWEADRCTPSVVQLAQWSVLLGMDVPIRSFPAGSPLHDAGQLAILQRFRERIGSAWTWTTEVPVVASDSRDRRAWDAVLTAGNGRVAVEAISRLVDVQGQVRPVVLKQQAGSVERVVLALADTRHNRAAVDIARPTLAPAFPCASRDALAALRAGVLPAANAVVLV